MLFYAIFLKLPWLSDEVGRSDEWMDPSLIQVVRGFMEDAVERQGLRVLRLLARVVLPVG